MTDAILTQSELKAQLHYSQETGIFTKILKSSGAIKIIGHQDVRGYIYIRLNRKKYSAHRLAWLYVYGYMPKELIDHINGIKSDNRISNLREATSQQNNLNTKLSTRNKYGAKGVHFNKLTNKWMAQSKLNGTYFYLGSHNLKEEAILAYENFAKEKHGQFYFKNSRNI